MKFIISALFFLNLSVFAQTYETVVEDIVFNTSSRVVFNQDTIQKSHAYDVPQFLSTYANIIVTSNSFQATSLSIRGGDSGHVLIIVDGIPYYDPSTIQRTGNLSALSIKSIKRIEVIKGSQSVLYGGQALGGVIKIETLPNEDRSEVITQVGTQSHYGLGFENQSRSLLTRAFYTERIAESPAKGSSRNYKRDQQNVDLAYQWNQNTKGFIKASYLRDYKLSPSSDINYQIVDVRNFKLSSEQGLISSQVHFQNQLWKPVLTLGFQNGYRYYIFPLSPDNPSPMDEDYKSQYHFIRIDARPFKSDTMSVDAGFSYSMEDFIFQEFNIEKADHFLEQRGLFTKITSKLDQNTELSYGGRVENWGNENPVSVYHAGLAIKNTMLEISTGFKTPTLYQLYSNYGNSNLKEEQATQYSLIQDFQLEEKQNFSLTVFYSQFKNLISTIGTFPNIQYTNIGNSETRGAEVSWNKSLTPQDSFGFSVTYQEPKDLDQHTWLLRRPLVNGNARYTFTKDNLNSTAEIHYVGTRKDFGPSERVRLNGFVVGNLSLNYQLAKSETASIRINNVGSSRHQETFGYYSEGLTSLFVWSKNF